MTASSGSSLAGFIPGPGDADLLAALALVSGPEAIQHVEHLPPRPGRNVDWPAWAPPEVVAAYADQGINRPWAHQAAGANAAHAGEDVVIATGTASGKSLAYQLPILASLLADPKACALYLSPTKALAADQLESLESLKIPGIRAARYDGDTPLAERDWARDHGRVILTNPDMLHVGLLPFHARWSRVLRHLRYIVVDECHSYRGVFGSHVALVLRRLRRIARLYGAEPVFVLASATVAEPAAAATALIGSSATAVTDDAAPRPGADFVLWEPPPLPKADTVEDSADTAGSTDSAPDPGAHPGGHIDDTAGDAAADAPADTAPMRRSAPAEAARIMATLVSRGARTLTFVRSRASAEQTAITTQRALTRTNPALAEKVSAYRGGYLPEDRRALERSFGSGELVGVVSTNALELGVDIDGVDAAILTGYPGTLASIWQQAGRAGRGDTRALIVFVARDDPLDSYLVHHPEAVFGASIEAAVTYPTNPYVLGPQLACAAAENRLTDDDIEFFGGAAARLALTELLADKVLRRRPSGYFFTGHRHPANGISLRGSGRQVAIVEAATGRMLGTEDALRAPASVHPGAVYLHQGGTYVVRELDLDGGVALVDADRPDWWTTARSVSSVELCESQTTTALSQRLSQGLQLSAGSVRVTEQVVGYLRRRGDGMLIDAVGLDMPEHALDTRAVWYTIPREVLLESLAAAGLNEGAIAGSLHAAEHAAIGLLPLFAGCDRWDIGGLSTALHPDTGDPTVIVYDGVPGGAGFADHGYLVAHEWLLAVRDAVRSCPCRSGCPSCVQSPKCGNGNQPLDKEGAIVVLDLVTSAF